MTQRRALVVRGGWEGHEPVRATELFLPFLERSGYAVRIEESTDVYADAAEMAGTDLVVQCVTMSQITPEQVAGLCAAVVAGTGFTGWHGGIVDSFRMSSDYLHLVGGQFATHPGKEPCERRGGAEDNFLPHTVRPELTFNPSAYRYPRRTRQKATKRTQRMDQSYCGPPSEGPAGQGQQADHMDSRRHSQDTRRCPGSNRTDRIRVTRPASRSNWCSEACAAPARSCRIGLESPVVSANMGLFEVS
ncbi:ThuA domain-containing protein [Micromonospora haikouensis]|uniref:ThuA domain-containing protein n=1 Tax=Micromonospora haikouensis TaxID=686309 RepID=UPI000A72271C|nr:ThuA domain-containing protein [Micromonospora haikouensis]